MDEDEMPTVPDVTSWITTVLDLSGALLVTVGLGIGLWPVIGGFGLAAAGGFLWIFSAYVTWRATAADQRPSTLRARAIIAFIRQHRPHRRPPAAGRRRRRPDRR